MLIDLFTYTTQTPECTLDAATILDTAKARGLDGVCITDVASSHHAQRWAEMGAQARIFVGVGVELVTDCGHLTCFAPELGEVMVKETWRRLTTFARPAASQVVSFFDEVGGAVIASHVFDQAHNYPMGDWASMIEGLAAIDVASPYRKPIENDLALEMARALSLPGVGGSRSKTTAERLGAAATVFGSPITDQARLVEALRGMQYWAISVVPKDAVEARRSEPPRRRSESRRSDRNDAPRRRKRPARRRD